MIVPRSTRRQRGDASETLNVPPLPASSATSSAGPARTPKRSGGSHTAIEARACRYRCGRSDVKQVVGVRRALLCEGSAREQCVEATRQGSSPKGEDAGGGFDRNATRARSEGVAMIQSKTKTSERIGAIDELRGLALVLVMLSHVGLVYGLETDVAYSLALPAFRRRRRLVLRDFGLCDLPERPCNEAMAGGNALLGARAFWVRRFVRIAAPAAGDPRSCWARFGWRRRALERLGPISPRPRDSSPIFIGRAARRAQPPARIIWSSRIFGAYRSKDNSMRWRRRSRPCPGVWRCRSP